MSLQGSHMHTRGLGPACVPQAVSPCRGCLLHSEPDGKPVQCDQSRGLQRHGGSQRVTSGSIKPRLNSAVSTHKSLHNKFLCHCCTCLQAILSVSRVFLEFFCFCLLQLIVGFLFRIIFRCPLKRFWVFSSLMLLTLSCLSCQLLSKPFC